MNGIAHTLSAGRLTVLASLLLAGIIFGAASKASAQNDGIHWYSSQKALELARKNKKKVLIFAQTDWNIYCKKMRKEVFSQQAVIDSMKTYFYAVKVNIESDSTFYYNGKQITPREFARNHQVHATPNTFFIDAKGTILMNRPGYISALTFSRLLGFVGSDAYRHVEFKTYLKNHTHQ